jgi:hypothetical protein
VSTTENDCWWFKSYALHWVLQSELFGRGGHHGNFLEGVDIMVNNWRWFNVCARTGCSGLNCLAGVGTTATSVSCSGNWSTVSANLQAQLGAEWVRNVLPHHLMDRQPIRGPDNDGCIQQCVSLLKVRVLKKYLFRNATHSIFWRMFYYLCY